MCVLSAQNKLLFIPNPSIYMNRFSLLALGGLWLSAISCAYAQTSPTWGNGIAALLYTQCTPCHHTGGIGTFALESYDDAVNNADAIKYSVQNRSMPPWKADPAYSHFLDERVLSAAEIDAISAWVDGGTSAGDTTNAPAAPVFTGKSQMPVIDKTLTMEPYTIQTNVDEYRTFVASGLGNSTERYINQVEFLPGNDAVVHHVVLFLDTNGSSRKLDELDPGAGFASDGSGMVGDGATIIGAWAPGGSILKFPANMGIKLPANADLVFEIHYSPNSKGQTDATSINLKFVEPQADIREVKTDLWLFHQPPMLLDGPLFIPANTKKTFHQMYNYFPEDVSLLAVFPHMHRVGRSFKIFGMSRETGMMPIIDIPKWDFNWQGFYINQRPMRIPSGATIFGEATYDNTTDNPDNPMNPPIDVRVGEHTTDEMMLAFFMYTQYREGDEKIALGSNGLPNVGFSLHPNPATSSITLGTSPATNITATIEIFDMMGSKIKTVEWTDAPSLTMDISSLNAGIYLAKIAAGMEAYTLKFVKQ